MVANGACYSESGALGALSGSAFRMTFRVRVRFVTVYGVNIVHKALVRTVHLIPCTYCRHTYVHASPSPLLRCLVTMYGTARTVHVARFASFALFCDQRKSFCSTWRNFQKEASRLEMLWRSER